MAPPSRRELPELYLDLLRSLSTRPFDLKNLQLYRFREKMFDELDVELQEGFITYQALPSAHDARIAFLGRSTCNPLHSSPFSLLTPRLATICTLYPRLLIEFRNQQESRDEASAQRKRRRQTQEADEGIVRYATAGRPDAYEKPELDITGQTSLGDIVTSMQRKKGE